MCKPCCSCAAVRALLKENRLAPVLWQFRKTISFLSFQSLGAAVVFAVSGVLASPQQQPGCPRLSLELGWGHTVQEDFQTWDMTQPITAVLTQVRWPKGKGRVKTQQSAHLSVH